MHDRRRHPTDACCARGAFVTTAGVAAVMAAIGSLSPARADAAAQAGAGIGPEAALARLTSGNRTFVKKMTATRKQTIEERAALGAGQAPWASILTCADSRVVPEIIFNVGLGDIFVSRVAGNVADPTETATLEYGAAVLGSQLIVVMGHSSCGAVKAAIDASKGEAMPSDHLKHLVDTIMPAVESVKGKPGDLLDNATRANVAASVAYLRSSALLKDLAARGKLKIVGAYYDMTSGKMSLLA